METNAEMTFKQTIFAKELLIQFVVVLFLMFPPSRASAEIAATFDMKDLSSSYALSCTAQAAVRHSHIPPPYFPGRPKKFRNDSESLVIYSPYLTVQERRTAQRLFASVPKYALPIAWRGGVVYVFVRRSIVEAVPALATEDSWFADSGLYMAVERRLYVPFEKGEDIVKEPDGTYAAQRFVPSQREPFRIINHETGHMIDSMLGEYSLDSRGDDGESRLSNRPDFLAALGIDWGRLASGKSPLSIEQIRKLGYYMPREYNGVDLGGVQATEQRARREIFAELWAEVHGHNSNRLYRAYPETFKVVKRIADFLKAQDAASPVHCKLRD